MRPYTADRDDLTYVRMVRDVTDDLRQKPELRTIGLMARRKIAVLLVNAALSVERKELGQ